MLDDISSNLSVTVERCFYSLYKKLVEVRKSAIDPVLTIPDGVCFPCHGMSLPPGQHYADCQRFVRTVPGIKAQTGLKNIFSKALCEGVEDLKKNARLDKSIHSSCSSDTAQQ